MKEVAVRTGSPKFRTAALLASLMGLCASHEIEAGTNVWTMNGPEGATVARLAIAPSDPSTLYVAISGGGGVFRTTDGGGSWTAADGSLIGINIVSLAIDTLTPTTVYAGTDSSHGVFKSADGGATWRSVNSGQRPLTAFPVIYALAIDPSTPTTLYAGTAGGGVFKSTDGAETWAAAGSALANNSVLALAIDPGTPTTLYAGTFSGVFKSTDGGGNWSAVNNGLTAFPYRILRIDPGTPTTLYAGSPGSIFKSTDGGGSWFAANNGLPGGIAWTLLDLAIDPGAPGVLYAALSGGAGAFKSTDGGGSWAAVGNRPSGNDVGALAIDPRGPATLYAGTSGDGVFRSADAGNSWRALNSGLPGRPISCLVSDPQTLTTLYAVAGGSFSGTDGVFHSFPGGLFKSTDGGVRWSFVGEGGGCPLVVDSQTPTILYHAYRSGIAKSTDGGATWRSFDFGAGLGLRQPIVTALAIDPQTPTTLYAGASSKPYIDRQGEGVFKSTDGGESWSRAGNLGGFTSLFGSINALAIDPRTPTTIHAGTGTGVCNSSDGGATWGCTVSGLSYYFIGSLMLDPLTPTTIYTSTPLGIHKSTDGGSHWSLLNSTPVFLFAIDPQTPTTFYGGIWGTGLFKSTDGGGSWSPLNAGLFDTRVTSLFVDSGNPAILHAGTRGGVFTLEQVPNRPPHADAGPDRVVEATGPDGALVALDGSGSSDPEGAPLTLDWSWAAGRTSGAGPALGLPMGTTIVTLTVTDPQGASATDTVQITVQDTKPPALQASLTPAGAVTANEGRFVADFSAVDLCSLSSVLAVMDIPAGAGAFEVVFSRDRQEPALSRVVLDYDKRRVTLEGGDEAMLRNLLATMITDGGVRVTAGQELGLRLDAERKQRYTFTFNVGFLVEEKAPAIGLRARAYDAAGNASTASAVPLFGGLKPSGGGARR